MAVHTDAKEKLLEFLDKRAFEPILDEEPQEYSGADRQDVEDVQQATRAERERFHAYESAEKIKDMFADDLRSPKAREINRKLSRLQLPTLPSLQEEFYTLCEDLGL